jgi:hypothetical protein
MALTIIGNLWEMPKVSALDEMIRANRANWDERVGVHRGGRAAVRQG